MSNGYGSSSRRIITPSTTRRSTTRRSAATPRVTVPPAAALAPVTPNPARQSMTNAQGQMAPTGYHYMPDGSLMLNSEHEKLYGGKVITSFNLSLVSLPASGDKRVFTITGDDGSEFILEIKNAIGYYYNFNTNLFQAKKTHLKDSISGRLYRGSIVFPSTITTDKVNGNFSGGATKIVMDTVVANTMSVGDRVTGNTALDSAVVTVAALNPDDDNTSEFSISASTAIADDTILTFSSEDQYDISLLALAGTKQNSYQEVRFGDETVDKNSSIGSKSLLIEKVIYQYYDTLVTIGAYSGTDAMVVGSPVNTILNIPAGKGIGKTPFSISTTSASGESYRIIKQPTPDDLLSFVQPVIGATPETLPGEDIYPAVSNTDTVDGVIVGGGSVIKVVMDTNVATKMAVGDKITAAVATDTVNGAVTSGSNVTMDANVATKMAVGDRITGSDTAGKLDTHIVTVTAINVGSDVKVFTMSEAVALDDGLTLTFTPKCNRSLTTVAVLNPDTDNVKEFSMSQNIGLIDGVTLSFSNQKNFQWPADNIDRITEGTLARGTNVVSNTTVSRYEDKITILEGTNQEKVIIKNQSPALNTKGQKPTIVKGLVTVQPGNIVFDKQQPLVLAGDTLKINGYGVDHAFKAYGYKIILSDLAIALTKITTTTTAASSSSTSVVLTARDGILNGVSTVSGIGINPGAVNPTVNSGASASGAGTVVLSAAQTLEDGITLTFAGAGKVATITGNIEIVETGPAKATLRFDIERLLTSA